MSGPKLFLNLLSRLELKIHSLKYTLMRRRVTKAQRKLRQREWPRQGPHPPAFFRKCVFYGSSEFIESVTYGKHREL